MLGGLTLLAFVVGFIVTIFLHEASHWLVAKWRGAEMCEFKPYPHKYNGAWLLGGVTYYSDEGFRPTRWIAAAPMVVSSVMLPLWVLGAYWCPYLWCFAYVALLDLFIFWQGYYGLGIAPEDRDRYDGWKFRYPNDSY